MRYISFLIFLTLLFSGCKKEGDKAAIIVPEVQNVSLPDKNETGGAAILPQKIIKQASLRFETNSLEDTFKQVQTAVKENKASIQNDTEGKDETSIYRTLTVRVPSQNFDLFMQSISKGVSYFDRKEISSEDVTEQYIDLDSRLKTKQKLESRYLEILQKATKISEILEIEKQISLIREEIEAKQGQLKYLESRVSESTITIEFYKPVAEKEGVKISYGSKIITAIQSGFFELSGLFIWLISVWPFIILFGLAGYYIRKRIKRKKI
ncbi:DUF4349 domain-containing protein [Flavobacterium poyangense]|uniref:DUF4349 domain-containing protein n=1 Tax=Flavobacterium poyangense TaxID=2204302 RepID=UPI00141E6BC1|nr:DUF4349 domain-containing protein [Flavobacterium sp. JXAS1]